MHLIIRPALVTDAEVICEFNRCLAKESEHKELDADLLRAGVLALLHDPHKGLYFVAEAHGQIIGQIGITFEWSDWRNGNFWWIQSVYVVKAARRQGVFRQLYHHVLRQAKALPDIIGVRLYVEQENLVAQSTYRTMGMQITPYQLMEQYPLT